jgi:ankyrin repeat protein
MVQLPPSQNRTCADIMSKYVEEFQHTLGFTKPRGCHAGYHAGMGDVEGLRWHLNHNRTIDWTYNFCDITDKLVLIAAKFCGRKNLNVIFQCLKEYGASFRVATKKRGLTAIHLLYFNLSLTKRITSSGDKLDTTSQAIKFLKESGCDINAKDVDGMTVLSYFLGARFLHQENLPVIQALLKNKADPNLSVTIKDWGEFDAKTALLQAVRNKWPTSVLEIIIKHGVDVKAVNKDNMNVLAIAAQNKDSDTLAWMLDNIYILNDSDCIKIAKKFSGKFTTKESRILSKKLHKSPYD